MAFLPASPDVGQEGKKEARGLKAVSSPTSKWRKPVITALFGHAFSDHHVAQPNFILKVYLSELCPPNRL